MKVAVLGASGFLGGKFMEHFSPGWDCIPVYRKDLELPDQELAEKLQGVQGIVNFMGAPVIGKKWTGKVRNELISSRVKPALKIMQILPLLEKTPEFYLSASATGLYRNGKICSEKENEYENDFLTQVILQWEEQALKFMQYGIRVLVIRLGVVLDREGGALKKLIPLFKWGLGGKIGSGKQSFAWISVQDALNAMDFLLNRKECHGTYNLVEPNEISNRDFTRAFAKAIRRPAFLSIPVFLLFLVYGEGARLLTDSKRVIPEKLIHEGFVFHDADMFSFMKKSFSRES